MNKEYKTFEELKEELGDKFEEFMYKVNIELLEKVNQLEANWDELKGWLKANDIHYAEAIPFRETLNKMQELEKGGMNE